jgi:GTP diphosphokinase / guanosine-3',5'-bis(diphosphate) 3'-diphosphatase
MASASSPPLEPPHAASTSLPTPNRRSAKSKAIPAPVESAPGVVSIATLTHLASQYLDADSVKRVREAYKLADQAHLGQFRSSGEPYISHPIAVAEMCAGWRLDTDALMAALLHDVLEDCGIEKSLLIERFGADVADLVDGLSKLDKMEFESREHAQAESFRKMLLAMARDVRVILIKLADRTHNMRTLDAVPANKRSRIARETLEIYAPIASRLGLYEVQRELSDLAFKSEFPNRHEVLRKAVAAATGNRREVVHRILDSIQRKLPELGVTAEVTGREKALYGIYQKMREKHTTFDKVWDVYGFRVVVQTHAECYLALGALHACYQPMPGRFKDYIALPKVNGYQSLHTVLVGPFGTPVEFQIRTKEMHRVAEAGVAAHWLYKNDAETFSDLQMRTHQWLQSLLDIQSQTGDSLEFLDHVKVDLFPDAVYVFTPKGQIRSVPRGSTVVDFAYSVHTGVGNSCVGARINQLDVPLRTELQNGDVVEVITDPNAGPNPTWLNFVRTGKARSEIRHYLRTLHLSESIDLGRRLFEQALAAMRVDAGKLDEFQLERFAKEAGAKDLQTLYADIGLGKTLAQIAARSVSLSLSGRHGMLAPIITKMAPVVIRGTEGMSLHYAPCCFPVPGDPVVGHMRGGHGLTIHRAECENGQRARSKDSERWVEVMWAEDMQGGFRSKIEVQTRNSAGVLGRVAAAISTAKANITSFGMDENDDQIGLMRFTLAVNNRGHLAEILRAVRRITEVQKVKRS